MENNRHEQREQAFAIVFQRNFTDDSLKDILKNTLDARDVELSDFAISLVNGVAEHIGEIDALIEKKAIGWSKNRISKVALSTLRLAIYEILFGENIPVGVTINEAVEITKTYATEKDASFVNGILGNIVRELDKK